MQLNTWGFALFWALLTGKYCLYNVTVVGDGSGVGIHNKIIICVLPNDTSNSSDCVMLSDWFMSGEFSAKTFNGYQCHNKKHCLNVFLKERTEDNLEYLSQNVPLS